jgi:hypothetical protein
LANSILSGWSIRPLDSWMVLFWSLLVIAAELFILVRLGPFLALGAGSALSLIAGAGFSWGFIISGCWIDPLIPFIASLAGTLTVFALNLLIVTRGARRFRWVYGPHVGKLCLRRLIRAGQPIPGGRLSTQSAIVAVRQVELLTREDHGIPPGNPQGAAAAVEAFRAEVATLFKKAGGVIIGCDGDLVLASFGSPLERIGAGPGQDPYVRYSHTPARRAAEFVVDLAGQEIAAPWRFGLDAGECAFGYLPVSGYSAYGRPVVRARILSGLASRYKVRALVSESVRTQLKDIPVRKLTVLKEQDGTGGEAVYQLVFQGQSTSPY